MDECRVIAEFLCFLRVEKRLSEQTLRCYAADLRQFSAFVLSREGVGDGEVVGHSFGSSTAGGVCCGEQLDRLLLSLDEHAAAAFIDFLRSRAYDSVTVARKLVTVRCLYKYLAVRGLVKCNPLVSVCVPLAKKKPPKYLTAEKIQRLLNAPESNNWIGARDKAMLETLYSTGIRVKELVMLNIEDVDFLGESLHVREKGKRERKIPLSVSALRAIQRYLELRNRRAESGVNFDRRVLFLNKHGKGLSTRSIRRKMKKYIAIAGLEDGISPHTLRHSCAMELLRGGADLRHMKELLGHQSLGSMKVYTDLAEEHAEGEEAELVEALSSEKSS